MADETPLDRFKQALTGASRALSREPEVEVAWSADNPAASGKSFRVPLPGRNLPPEQAREARGCADSFSLKLRHHNTALHSRNAPPEPVARACYDTVEQVRYEALGANNFSGIAGNLDAATELRTASDPISRAQSADDVPLQSALSLLLREKLTGRPIPARAQAGVEMVRHFIEERAGADFEALALSLDDQTAFQSLALDMLRHLELTKDEGKDGGEDDEGEDEEGGEDEGEDDSDEDSGQNEPQTTEMAGESSESEDGEGDSESETSSEEEMNDGEAGDEGEEGMMPVRPNRPWTDLP
ncbi:MAG: cobaltochelatase subunit CobT, partial [Allopontixanthobacter sediminis]